MIAIPAARYEFGIKIFAHVPAVHALTGPKVVFIEEGEHALYPSATEHIEVERKHDDKRRNNWRKDAEFVAQQERQLRERFPKGVTLLHPDATWPKRRFIPQPHVRQTVSADVVVCPRKRNYGASKNWPHWPDLTAKLAAEGLSVFAGGVADSSFDVPAVRAWDFTRSLDATIEAMLSARLVVATDAGLAHLAVLCGRPLLVITHANGLVAPGPVSDDRGRVEAPRYWPVKWHRYTEANHMNAPLMKLHDAWTDPAKVFSETLRYLRGERAA